MQVFKYLFSSLILISSVFALEDPTVDHEYMKTFWKKGSLPVGLYYGLVINGEHFGGGARQWEPRWAQIKNAMNFEGKRILEFGGNVGLCSIFMKKYCNAERAVVMDFKPEFKKFNEKLQKAFDVEVDFYCLNIDQDPYERILGNDYDVAICMSFFWWVKQKNRFLHYLSNIPNVIYEGHDTLEVEVNRMKQVGFLYHKLLGYGKGVPVGLAKGKRPVILFSKYPIR